MALRGETRTRVVETARCLFRTQGYHATGVNQILAEAAAPKGSLYFHFPGGKQQLAAEAVTAGALQLRNVIDAVVERSADPMAASRAIGDLLADHLVESDFRNGCPIAGVALDASDSDVVRQACNDGFSSWLQSLTDYLTRSGIEPESASDLALLAISSLEGALLLARTERDAAPIRRVADRIAKIVAQEMKS
ncbi:TetR/AcrR family transcriptional regulator [Antrihabitans cavernicola]|uniref:TetR/AcrR family transcriptional regulator n=1 Tax=Antrihabitans cavernicola TaxID=2495913 RepID=A0A5A7S6J6_9NOCA|nr:TetR/AcrR family transcriptional regulator [Spelaeibacter cavernicola]KAA0018905.1 TetR/AcrR family transcriptional regulator [Spelaeibacter cavernicola]